jgi:hypothetical protein
MNFLVLLNIYNKHKETMSKRIKKIKDSPSVEMQLLNKEIKERIDALIIKAKQNQVDRKRTFLEILFNL